MSEPIRCHINSTPKTKEIVDRIYLMKRKPGMCFGKRQTMTKMNYVLSGIRLGIDEKEPWGEICDRITELHYKRNIEFYDGYRNTMGKIKKSKDEELLRSWFDTFDEVIRKEYPDYFDPLYDR